MNPYLVVIAILSLIIVFISADRFGGESKLEVEIDGQELIELKPVTENEFETPDVLESVDTPPASVAPTSKVTGGVTVDLSNRGLVKVPEYIFGATNTNILNLSYNKLSGALPAEIRHLQNLYSLDLSNNNFTGVPAEIGQLSKLEVLNLSNNPITGLPYELGNLKNLKVLDLRGTNYAAQDLEVIKKGLSSSVSIYHD